MKRGYALLKIVFLLMLLFFPVKNSGAADNGRKRFQKGPFLSKTEATSIIRHIFKKRPFTVLKIQQSPVEGLWEIIVETKTGRTILYIDASKRYFLGGPILSIGDNKNKTEESLLAYSRVKHDVSSIPLDDALVLGDPSDGRNLTITDEANGEGFWDFTDGSLDVAFEDIELIEDGT